MHHQERGGLSGSVGLDDIKMFHPKFADCA